MYSWECWVRNLFPSQCWWEFLWFCVVVNHWGSGFPTAKPEISDRITWDRCNFCLSFPCAKDINRQHMNENTDQSCIDHLDYTQNPKNCCGYSHIYIAVGIQNAAGCFKYVCMSFLCIIWKNLAIKVMSSNFTKIQFKWMFPPHRVWRPLSQKRPAIVHLQISKYHIKEVEY